MSDIFVGIDVGLRGAITVLNTEGIPLSVFKMPLIYVDRKKSNKNNGIQQEKEEHEIDINSFKIAEYRDPKRYVKSQIKKSEKVVEKKTPKKTVLKTKVKITDEWYDADKILEYIKQITKLTKNINNVHIVMELQNPFFAKNRGGNKLLRGFGLLEGLFISEFGQKSIELISPITWQKKLFAHYLGDDIISSIRERDIVAISKSDQYLQNEFPDILANIISLMKKKSVQPTKILSVYCLYSMYRDLLVQQSFKVHYKEKEGYKIYNGLNMTPDKNDLLMDIILYSNDNNISDAFCLAEYGRMSFLNQFKK